MKISKKVLTTVVLIALILTGCSTIGNKSNIEKEKGEGEKDIITSEDKSNDSQVEVDPEIEASINEAFEMLQKHGDMSKQVWPDYDISQNNIIACEVDDITNKINNAWKLTTTSKERLTNEQLKDLEVPPIGAYNGVKFEGKESIVIGISKDTLKDLNEVTSTNFVYEVGVHEMFHLYYESFKPLLKIVKQSNELGDRGTVFPKKAEPRVYRKMILDNLILAFENPKDEDNYLGKAKYWNEKWKAEYSEEYNQVMLYDILEGKARYIQEMMCILYKGISEAEKINAIENMFDKSPDPSESNDSESYKLGFAAGVLLDRTNPTWKEEITKNPKTPVELLLKDVTVIEDNSSDITEKLKTSEHQMNEVNEIINSKLKDIKVAESNVDIPFLKLNDKFLNGSFQTSDFINYMGLDINTDFGGSFENKNGNISLEEISVYSIAGKRAGYILPLTMDYEISDGRIIIDANGVKGDIKVKQTKDKEGRIIYIMK
ncbi:MAG: hypothetical protein RR894_18980 [Terrisporobacter sp.]